MCIWKLQDSSGTDYYVLARSGPRAIQVLEDATGLVKIEGLHAVGGGEIVSVHLWDLNKFKDETKEQVITFEQYYRGSL